MFKIRTKKIINDIWARKGRSLMVILSITIGVFGVATMMSITDLLRSQMKEDIRREQISHTQAYVISGGASLSAEENRAYMDQLEALPGVVEVEGQAVYPVTWQTDASEHDAVLFGFNDAFADTKLQGISRIIEGRYPIAGQHEIGVEPRFAQANDLAVGDVLRFPNTGDAEWEIVGILLHPYYAEFPANQTAILVEEQIFANYDDAQQIVGFTGLSVIYARYQDTAQSQAGLGELIDAISLETPYVTSITYQDDPENSFFINVMSEMLGAMDALGIVAMLISGFLVTNVMNTVIVEQRRQIGAMKSLGATFIDNLRIYAGMALIYGVIGTALGLILAVPVAANTARPVADWAYAYIEGNQVSRLGLGVGLAMGLVVPGLAACLPILQASRVSILEAVTDLGIASDWGTSRLARFVGRLPLPLIVMQASNNIIKKKERLALTILTLTAAVAAFMGATAVTGSLNNFGDTMTEIYNYEIRMIPQVSSDYDEIAQLVETEVEGVAAIYPGITISARVPGFVSNTPLQEGSDQVTLWGFDSTSPTYNFNLREGDGWSDDSTREGVIISRTIAENLDKGVGDSLSFSLNGQTKTYEIIGVDSYVFDAIFIDWQDLAAIANYVDADGQPLVSTVYFILDGNPSIEAVDAKIEEITNVLGAHDIQGTYFNEPRAAETSAEQTSMLGIIFQMMAMVMAAVSAIGLLGALSMAVLERQKEIGVMRSVGARSRTIMGQFMLEGVMIGFLAWLAAIPLSVVMSQGFLSIIPIDYLDLTYPPQLVLTGLVGVMIVVFVASAWPSFVASRKTIADILRYQ